MNLVQMNIFEAYAILQYSVIVVAVEIEYEVMKLKIKVYSFKDIIGPLATKKATFWREKTSTPSKGKLKVKI